MSVYEIRPLQLGDRDSLAAMPHHATHYSATVPHAMLDRMRRWRRVGVFGTAQVGSTLFALVGLSLTAVLVRGLFFAGPRPGLVFALLGTSLWTAAAWRIGRIGMFVNDNFGVRSRSMLRTRTLPWLAIAAFEDRPATAGPYGWAANMLRQRAIWIVPKHDPAFQTALIYTSSQPEFLPPEPGLLADWERMRADINQMPPLLSVRKGAERARMVGSEQQVRASLDYLRGALRKTRHPRRRRRGRAAPTRPRPGPA